MLNSCLPKFVLLLALAASSFGRAATLDFGFIGDPSTLVESGEFPLVFGTVPLVNEATGTMAVPPLTISVGDMITTSVTLASPLTVPGSVSYAGLSVVFAQTSDVWIYYWGVPRFFLNGLEIAPLGGANAGIIVGSTGLRFGVIAASPELPSFTFDEFRMMVTVTSIVGTNNAALLNVSVPHSAPELSYFTNAPVPEPSSVLLLSIGVLGLARFVRSRRYGRSLKGSVSPE
jgi:hypothetical protein